MAPEPINVSSARAAELFQGKAASTIKDLMVENSQLSAVVEVLTQRVQEQEQALQDFRNRDMSQRMASAETLPRDPSPPQDASAV